MTPFDYIIIIGGICGFVMVVGGILLLWKGVIKLEQVDCDQAVTLEFQKVLKLQTRYPALGLFIIGLSFILTALFYSKPANVRPISLQGKIIGAEPSAVKILVNSDTWAQLEPDSDGNIDKIFYPDNQKVYVQVIAAGCNPPNQKFTLSLLSNRSIVLPNLSFVKVADKPEKAEIVEAPSNLPPLNAKTTKSF